MSILDIFLITVYSHFSALQKRRPRVIPWFQTCFLISLTLTISTFLIADLILSDSSGRLNIPEFISIIVFISIGGLYFWVVKKYFFDTGKHLELFEKFLELYTPGKRILLKIIVLGTCCIIPFLLGFLIWYRAK